ncbi:MAG: response regulator [Croceivirga sp.]
MKTPKHVMVLDHDPNTIKLCNNVFQNLSQVPSITSCSSLREAIAAEDSLTYDLLICETTINGQSGIRYISDVLRRKPTIKVLVLSERNDFDLIKQAFKFGVHGYLTKPVTSERFRSALETIANNGTALSHDVSNKIVAVFKEFRHPELSQRENQIIGYLGKGATYKDIAKKLFVTPSTVNFHLQNIYVKLNVKSKSEALFQLRTMESATY